MRVLGAIRKECFLFDRPNPPDALAINLSDPNADCGQNPTSMFKKRVIAKPKAIGFYDPCVPYRKRFGDGAILWTTQYAVRHIHYEHLWPVTEGYELVNRYGEPSFWPEYWEEWYTPAWCWMQNLWYCLQCVIGRKCDPMTGKKSLPPWKILL